VDGNDDGVIDIADGSTLAENFFSEIRGYDVFFLPIDSLEQSVDESDFLGVEPAPNPLDPSNPRPSVPRTLFYSGGIPPSSPIVYSQSFALQPGFYAVAVRPFSDVSDDYSDVPFSNIEKFEITGVPVNHPPYWVDVVGIQEAEPMDSAVRVAFGDASDPDGDEVIFRIYYAEGETVDPSSPLTRVEEVARSSLPPTPPFSVAVGGLLNGLKYAFMVRVYDEYGLEESPANSVILTAIPFSSGFNPFPWPYFRKDEKRSGQSSASQLTEALTRDWEKLAGNNPLQLSSVVLDDENVYVVSVHPATGTPAIYAYAQQDGADVPGFPVFLGEFGDAVGLSTPALYQDFIVVGISGSYEILRRTDQTRFGQFPLVNQNAVHSSPLIFGGLIFAGSNEGTLYCFNLSGQILWARPLKVDVGPLPITSSPSTDGRFIFAASEEGYVYKLSLGDGTILATSPDLGTIRNSSPVPFSFQGKNYILICADIDTEPNKQGVYLLGADELADELLVLSHYETELGAVCTPLVVEKPDSGALVVVGDQHPTQNTLGRIYGLELDESSDTLIPAWEYPQRPSPGDIGGVYSSPIASGQRIFVTTERGLLYVFDDYGNLTSQPPIQVGSSGERIFATPAINGDRFFIVTSLGRVVCFRSAI